MLITTRPGGAPDRTWRPSLPSRIAGALCVAVIASLPTGYVALTLVTNQVSDGGWIALALGVAAWAFLAGRVLNQSAALGTDTLVIRNVFTTERVPLADVTEVGFRRGQG